MQGPHDDCCIICAEPLQYTAYGQCGHKESCSRCVTRMRSILKDERCPYCQQPLASVFVTRFLGEYTAVVPASQFEQLQVSDRYSCGVNLADGW
jgi:hypothetical protein